MTLLSRLRHRLARPAPAETGPEPASAGVVANLADLVARRGPAGALALAAPGRVRTLQAGAHRSPYRGRGMEFDEVRAYQAGDDVRTIDWRVTARTGRVHTKLFHEERERPVLLLVDLRPAMRFGTRGAFKSVAAARAAAVLAWAARDGGDRVGGFVLTARGHQELAPHRARQRTLGFLSALAAGTAETAEGPGIPLGEGLARLARVARPGSLVFVLSDFADLDHDGRRHLERLAAHCDLACLLVHDPLEAAPPPPGRYRVSDGTHMATLPADDPDWRRAYADLFARRRQDLADLCRRRRIVFVPLRTDDDAAEVLRHGLVAGKGGRP